MNRRDGSRASAEGQTIIADLLRFLEIDDATKAQGRELWKLLAPKADAAIEKFYQKVRRFEISPHVTDDSVERLKQKQKQHWAALFGSQFGESFTNSIRRIGVRHRDIELSPLWYVAGYVTLKLEFMRIIAEADLTPAQKGRMLGALDKYVAIDMAVALSTYTHTVAMLD